ncbi:MAG: YhgE/Pip family protein [Coriobacteriia bacterium]
MSRLSFMEPVQGRRPITWVGLIMLVLLPALLVAVVTWALWNSDEHLDRTKAAIVNSDKWVTVNGQVVPLGRSLAGELVDGDDTYDWVLTTEKDAQTGLKDGTYAAIVRIPEDFSANATSIAATDTAEAKRATVSVQISSLRSATDAANTRRSVQKAVDSLANTLSKSFLDQIFVGFSTAAEGMQSAADGATSLASGAGSLASGISAAADGTFELADGLGTLSSGTSSLAQGIASLAGGVSEVNGGTADAASGAKALAAGTSQLSAGASALSGGASSLASGAGQVSAGIGQLSSGLATLKASTSGLPASVSALDAGASSLATGAEGLATGAAQSAAGAAGLATGAEQLADAQAAYAQQLAALAAANPGDVALQQVAAGAAALAQQTSVLAAGAAQSATGASGVSSAAAQLSAGASQLAAGTSQFAASAPALASGISDAAEAAALLASGASGVASGANQTASGAASLASGVAGADSGVSQLASGLSALASGTSQLASGANDTATGARALATGAASAHEGSLALAQGSVEISNGASSLAEGAGQLASGLSDGANAIPTYSESQRTSITEIAANPVGYEQAGPDWENLTLLLSVGIAGLWLGTLAVYAVAQAVSRRALLSSARSSRIVASGLLPSAIVGVVLGVALVLAAWLLFGLGASEAALLLGMLVLAGVAFAAVNQALVTLFGGWGHVVSVAMLAVCGAAAYFSAVPTAFASIASALPPALGLAIAKEAASGLAVQAGESTLLAAWAVIAVVLALAATMRRRTVSVRDLDSLGQ